MSDSTILTYTDIDREAWSRLVQTSRTGTWFQSPEAYSFYESMPELFRPFAFGIVSKAESDSGLINEETLHGVCVGYVTVEKNPIKQFFTRRTIIIGGPCLADDATEEDVETLMRAVREKLSFTHLLIHSPIYIETRNFNDYSKWKDAFAKAGFEYKPHLNFHIDCTSKEAMWERLSDNRKRQVKKAFMNGAEIVEVQNEKDITDWYEILKKLYYTKVKTPLFPLSFFIEFYQQGVGKYLLVKYEGKVTGGIMCPIFDGKCIYEWFVCGMDNEYKKQYPSVMATWAAMEYANGHNLPMFDIMGAGEPDKPYGVRDFKAEFGGELVEHGRWLHVERPLLYAIGKIGVRALRLGN